MREIWGIQGDQAAPLVKMRGKALVTFELQPRQPCIDASVELFLCVGALLPVRVDCCLQFADGRIEVVVDYWLVQVVTSGIEFELRLEPAKIPMVGLRAQAHRPTVLQCRLLGM